MVGGDAAMLLALADSLFLSIDPTSARGKVLLFLVISFAPFLVIAPLIGPFIDRMAGGRRLVIQMVAVVRIVSSLLMALFIDDLALFPLVFVALVMQKTYVVSKSALVPTVVRNESEFVEANSKLGLIGGIIGVAAAAPAGLLQLITGSAVPTLVYSALVFGYGFLAASRLPHDRVAAKGSKTMLEDVELHGLRMRLSSTAMLTLRCCVGFMFFHIAFWVRDYDDQTKALALFGMAVSLSSLGAMAGNALSTRLRAVMSEDNMLRASLLLVIVCGLVTSVLGSVAAGIALAVVANFTAAVGRLGFEAIVQREAPKSNHGRAFAVFETRFQLGWAAAGLIPIIITMPGALGLLIVTVIAAAGLVNYFLSPRLFPDGATPVRDVLLMIRHRWLTRNQRRPQPASEPAAPMPPPRHQPAPGDGRRRSRSLPPPSSRDPRS